MRRDQMVRWDKFVFSDFEFDENIEEKLTVTESVFMKRWNASTTRLKLEEISNLETDST